MFYYDICSAVSCRDFCLNYELLVNNAITKTAQDNGMVECFTSKWAIKLFYFEFVIQNSSNPTDKLDVVFVLEQFNEVLPDSVNHLDKAHSHFFIGNLYIHNFVV